MMLNKTAKNSLRIAIQSKGRLQKPSEKFLKSLGFKFKTNGRNLIVQCKNKKAEILYVRNGDIPEYVGNQAADFGIVGENVLREKNKTFEIVQKLGFGACSLVIAVPKKSKIAGITDLEGERIATSYPNTLKKYLKKNGVNASIIEIKGSVEIAPSLDLADAICDISQTGRTLEENGLRIIATVLESQAVLICASCSRKNPNCNFLLSKKTN